MATHDAIPDAAVTALRDARRVGVFTGAGVSAESGIPTFRDALTGLWERFDAAELASADAFLRNPDLVWGWYEWRRMSAMRAQPNAAHRAIAELAAKAPQLTLVTQNVDDLHERAGSDAPIHLHGSLFAPRCFACNRSASFPPVFRRSRKAAGALRRRAVHTAATACVRVSFGLARRCPKRC